MMFQMTCSRRLPLLKILGTNKRSSFDNIFRLSTKKNPYTHGYVRLNRSLNIINQHRTGQLRFIAI